MGPRADRPGARPARRAGARPLSGAGGHCGGHGTTVSVEETDWARIADLYAVLGAQAPSPFVELNWAVALAMADGPLAGLRIVDALVAAGHLTDYHLLWATQADLLRRTGQLERARTSYLRALRVVPTEPERRFLRSRLDSLGADESGAEPPSGH